MSDITVLDKILAKEMEVQERLKRICETWEAIKMQRREEERLEEEERQVREAAEKKAKAKAAKAEKKVQAERA